MNGATAVRARCRIFWTIAKVGRSTLPARARVDHRRRPGGQALRPRPRARSKCCARIRRSAISTSPARSSARWRCCSTCPRAPRSRRCRPSRPMPSTTPSSFLGGNPEIALYVATLLARRLYYTTSYLVDLQQQSEGKREDLDLVDKILAQLDRKARRSQARQAHAEVASLPLARRGTRRSAQLVQAPPRAVAPPRPIYSFRGLRAPPIPPR